MSNTAPLKRHAWGLSALVILLSLLALFVWRVAVGPLVAPPAEYTGKLNHAQKMALKERGCNLVQRTASGNPVLYYCWQPEPKAYPARQLIESLPKVGWVMVKEPTRPGPTRAASRGKVAGAKPARMTQSKSMASQKRPPLQLNIQKGAAK